ncbi:oxidoreductase [Stenotrophomonas sp. YAU14D1_LEIMI4_1]|uniref:oxidoreductase n=1 Tax=Stenotrophomonas sp. YAU14D1_LEIMI4_1 TaxID=2072407 RepID=UPI000D5424BB|nr:oxidoreductase [Stenotrophomonas sp. YAU14D1_LEIMI4_1]AWH25464.1 oxidoreductase [Stenotrophomonas sp. YAU14D1_LEIMI4_1]
MSADNTQSIKILLVGSGGLVGQGVALACADSGQVQQVSALVRRNGAAPAGFQEMVLPDFLQAAHADLPWAGFDACFYCAGAPPLGTPEAEYRQVTVDATLAVARAWAAANPQGCFLYVSGAHANPASRIMPLRVKGEIEHALARLPVRTVMLRPAGVQPVAGTGTRHTLMKPFYWVAAPLMGLAGSVLPSLTVSNRAIGEAMIALAGMAQPPGVVECAQIHRFARAVR